MQKRHLTLLLSVTFLLVLLLACRVGTPTPPPPTEIPPPTETPLPPEPEPTAVPTETLPEPTPEASGIDVSQASVTEVLFFESAYEVPPLEEREYHFSFPSTSRYINCELNLEHPMPEQQVNFTIRAIWYEPDGSVFAEEETQARVEPGWDTSSHSFGRGWDDPGQWSPGSYRVEIFVNGSQIAEGEFEVVQGSGGIAFVSGRDGPEGNIEIYRMDVDSGNVLRLTDNPAADDRPGWSPDGSQIVFQSDRDGNDDIYVMDADGGNVVRLTDDPARDINPAWSPDGSRIAFVSYRENADPGNCWPDCNTEIYVLNLGDGSVTRLTDDPAEDGSRGVAWSPDGSQIAFDSYRGGGTQLYLMNADGGDVRRLLESECEDFDPAYSPDGAQIAFTSSCPMANGIIEMVDADGSNRRVVTDDRTGDAAPTWAPGGMTIAFWTNRDGNGEIYSLDLASGEQVNMTQSPAYEGWPAWSPQ